MDPWTILVGVGACCISAVLIYVIMHLSMREKSFEEVIAEQKKRQDEEREKIRNDRKMEKELTKKKYKKGKGEKSKEKGAQALDSQQKTSPKSKEKGAQALDSQQKTSPKSRQKESKMVSLELEPEIIEPSDSVMLGKQKSKGHSNARKRSILHNKDEVAPMVEKSTELSHKSIKPLDDLELKKLHDSKTHPGPAAKKGKAQHTDHKEEVKETKVHKTKATDLQHGAPVEEKAVKSKSATAVNSKPVKGSPLMDTLRTAELSDVEIQSLIEVLLNRQGAGSDFQGLWNKKNQKGDPVAVMKKQLEEKERSLQEEQQRVVSSMSQMKELRASLAVERERVSGMEKRYQSQLSQQESEKEALKARLSTIHATHMADSAKVKVQLEQVESQKSAEAAACLKLKQENKILQESLSKAIADSVVKGDVSGLKQKVAIMEKELSSNAVRLNASENAKKSSEEKLKKYEEQIKNLESAKKPEEALKKQVSELKAEVSKAQTDKRQLSGDLKKATGALSTVEGECAMWKSKLQELEKHLSSLADLGAKLQGSERKSEKLEGSVKSMEKQLAEAVTAQKEANAKLQQVQQENSALSQQLKVAQDWQQTQTTSSNGDVHTDTNRIHTAEHERIVSEKVAELTKVQAALDDQTKKNNEEVTRAVRDSERRDREVLRRLFPAVSLPDNMEHKEWLSSFEKQVAQQKEQSSISEHSEKDRIQQLEEENRKLQHQSEAYEKNFVQLNADQERLLHVEEENQRLKNLSATNTSLVEEISQLREQNKELESTLREKEESITEVETKLQNLERVVEHEEKKWKEKVKQAEESVPKGSESSSREQELEDLTIQQQTQIEHYRSVLTNTEQLLRQLESGEKTWEGKLQASQEDLQKTKSDCQRLQEELHSLRGSTEDLSDLGFAYRCVEKSLTGIVDEMQGRLDELQEELRQSSEQVDSLTKSNEQLTSKVIVLECQNKAIVQVDSENVTKELAEIRGQLEGEHKRNKELSSTLVRLNGIIKTGQDALSQEQKLVQQLQEQLTNRSKGSGSNASQEIEQLRSKLSEKEKQLEREIAANKQLSQRLGQLGVLGTSASSDQGTSV